VVPKFSHVYEDIQGNLPLMSQLLLKLGKFLGANGLAVAVVGLGACTDAAASMRSAWSRRVARRGEKPGACDGSRSISAPSPTTATASPLAPRNLPS